ncbi:hypothetical protein I552_0758 [Mycobacterium xenopi 3993]|nr:hypothetical protein I552_0758 [Mycobacterium xenopi 3993]
MPCGTSTMTLPAVGRQRELHGRRAAQVGGGHDVTIRSQRREGDQRTGMTAAADLQKMASAAAE